MSAISNKFKPLPKVHIYRTKIKVVIHSHGSEKSLVLKQEVRGFTSNKDIKSPGTATVTLVANKNYLDCIFPNDYINIYIDRGDEEGFTRVFFGFVDRITESYSVETNGTPSTSYTLSCTDFQKVFDKTMIYFNPHVYGREDFDGSWIGTLNIGGLALASKGVAVTGSPADVLLVAIFVLLGAASQFTLPTGYTPKGKDALREQRAQFAIRRLNADILKTLPNGSSILDFLTKSEEYSSRSTLPKGVAKQVGYPVNIKDQAVQEAMTKLANSLKNQGLGSLAAQTTSILATTKAQVSSFLDILDTFTFVEREATDGYLDRVSIWQNEGSVYNMLVSMSNEPVNELFFDLRPTMDSSGLTEGDNWSREPDELGGNLDDKITTGIKYTPSMIFREYPFSTVQSMDLSAVNVGITGQGGAPFTVGNLHFGAIFSNNPNVKGRHVVEMPSINVESSPDTTAKKHLDVAVIHPSEIMSTELGRSDHDHFNLMTFAAESVMGSGSKYYMHDILPIVSPVHIMRHGLRVRDLSTSFVSYAEHMIPKVTPGTAETEQTEPVSVDFSGSVVSPIAIGHFTETSPYGIWRARPTPATATDWIFHHGVDFAAPTGTPVVAVADGYVVAAAPAGTSQFKGYGNCVVIKHNDLYQGKTVYSLYAHLDTIDDSLFSQNPNKIASISNAVSRELLSRGKMQSFPIRAGAPVGTVGQTQWVDSTGNVTKMTSGAHLHFEINLGHPSKKTDIGVPPKTPYTGPSSRPAVPDFSTLGSLDPVEFLSSHGVNISGVPSTFDPLEDGKDDENDDLAKPNEDDIATDEPVIDSEPTKNLDNSRVRSALARWALLNDHWYQHNLEYLSGSIRMRGAPEIRVGYRLDIDDANRPLSFYVEGVSHSWTFPDKMDTSLTVTRGQPNNPFPVYVLPYLKGIQKTTAQRKTDSRLGQFFLVPRTGTGAKGTFIGSSQEVKQDTESIDWTLTNDTRSNTEEMFIAENESFSRDKASSTAVDYQSVINHIKDAIPSAESLTSTVNKAIQNKESTTDSYSNTSVVK